MKVDPLISRFFPTQDLDGTGKIRYTEFLAATIEANGAISEERLAEAFDRLDADDTGYISVENLKEMLGEGFATEDIEAIIKEAATDNDGKISYAEFLALWEDHNELKRDEFIQEITVLKSKTDSERSVTLSAMSGDESDLEEKTNHVARARFIDGQKLSERKVRQGIEKRVLFNASVETIPC